MKNAFDVLISKFNVSEDGISELEDSSMETSKTKTQRKNNSNNNNNKTKQTYKNVETLSSGIMFTKSKYQKEK